MPACPRLLLSLRPSKPGKRNLCVLSWKRGGCRVTLKTGNGHEGSAFVLPGLPRRFPGAGLQVATREAAFCNPNLLQREFRNTFSRCCSGQPRRSQTIPAWVLQPPAVCRGGADLQLAGKFFPAFSAALEPFGQKYFVQVLFCPYPLLIVVCGRRKFWNHGGCYLLPVIFYLIFFH